MNRRELARLMGTHTFRLPRHYNNAYRAMGDAVAVPAVRWLSDRLLTPLAEMCGQIPRYPAARARANDYFLNRSLTRMEQWKRNGA